MGSEQESTVHFKQSKNLCRYLKYKPKERNLEASEIFEPGVEIIGSPTGNEVLTTFITDKTENMLIFFFVGKPTISWQPLTLFQKWKLYLLYIVSFTTGIKCWNTQVFLNSTSTTKLPVLGWGCNLVGRMLEEHTGNPEFSLKHIQTRYIWKYTWEIRSIKSARSCELHREILCQPRYIRPYLNIYIIFMYIISPHFQNY